MNALIPDLSQFQLEELGQTPPVENPNAEVSFKVDIEPSRVTRRIVVGILDESCKRGISIAIYPATGEVCDLTNGGGVIGYLSRTPLNPGVPVSCDLTLYRFGSNFVCSARVQGEIFLYPAFSMDGTARLTAFVGQEKDGNGSEQAVWSRLRLDVLEQPVAA
ncbi:MAG: hypothetical protein P1U68_11775 [Verrucomicrobiales bacterium]|nr:hypothetical protein [Verrucomicrobiales bacterium]